MDARIQTTIAELEVFMKTVDDAMAIPRPAAAFVHALLLASGARFGVEIGTSYGYSALWAAAALRQHGGRLITIDHDGRKCEQARENFRHAGLADTIEIREGRAHDVLATIDGPVDYLLSDADKPNCIAYVEQMVDRLADRAVVLTDNTLTHPEQLSPFVEWVRQRPDFYSSEVPVGNGMELSVKRMRAEPV